MRWLSLLALGLLTACGPLSESSPALGLVSTVTVATGQTADSEQGNVASQINRDFIEEQPNELMLVSVVSRQAVAVVARAGNNGSKVTWLSTDGIGLVFDRGVLVATRGFGPDMMGADVSGTTRGFVSGVNYMKRMSYLDGLDQVSILEMSCSMVRERSETITIYERNYDTNLYLETCAGGGETIQNFYWRAADGIIWQARQWVSADVGYLVYQRL